MFLGREDLEVFEGVSEPKNDLLLLSQPPEATAIEANWAGFPNGKHYLRRISGMGTTGRGTHLPDL